MKQVIEQGSKLISEKSNIANALSSLASSISALLGVIFTILSKYMDMLGTLGQVLSWAAGLVLMIVSIRYYITNNKLKKERLKQIQREKEQKQEDEE